MKKIIFLSLIFLSFSCAHHNQKIDVDVVLKQEKSYVGHNINIDLKVIDDRVDDKFLGEKTFLNDEKIKIFSSKNLAKIFAEKLTKGFEFQGFVVGKGKSFELKIKEISYNSNKKFFIGNSVANSSIEAIVKNSDGSVFSKNFSLNLKRKHLIGSFESTDAEIVNQLVEETINDILSNQELLKYLVK
jgi:uncharacterized lipoprotein YajG